MTKIDEFSKTIWKIHEKIVKENTSLPNFVFQKKAEMQKMYTK